MAEKVVLPKFEVHSESRHPAIKVIMAVAGLLVSSMLILGWAVWHRRTQQVAAEHQRDAIIAERVAEANAALEAAKAKEAEAAAEQAKIAQAKAAADAAKAAAADKTVASADGPAASHHHDHGHHHGRAAAAKGKGGAVAAKDSDDKKAAPKSTRDNAAIDKLLASFNK